MTLEETVEYFRDMVEGCGALELCPCFKDDMEMTKIALSALEKQIPKRVKKTDIGSEIEAFYCPCCGKYYGNKIKHNYYLFGIPQHCDCGQALDWREME